jgi:hypothetical protein
MIPAYASIDSKSSHLKESESVSEETAESFLVPETADQLSVLETRS